jgi:hypothetical protein
LISAPPTTNAICSNTTAKIWPAGSTSYGASPVFCTAGDPPAIDPLFPTATNPTITWTCAGLSGGDDATCNASLVVNGVCGIAAREYTSTPYNSEIDYLEYSTDALARSSYVSSDATRTYGSDVTANMTSNVLPSPLSASASSQYNTTYYAWKAFDGNTSSEYWRTSTTNGTGWLKINLGSGITKKITKVSVTAGATTGEAPKNFTLQASNDDSTYTTLLQRTNITWTAYQTQSFTFDNNTNYRYYKLDVTSTGSGTYVQVGELQLFETASEGNLQVWSESTVKNQGSYSLKGAAVITNSLNDTLTKTYAYPINLTGAGSLKFDIYSSRTGSNIKLGIYQAGVMKSEITPNITTANTWQTVTWDISGVSTISKNAIDSIVVTITNATAANTFYLDNLYAYFPTATSFGGDAKCATTGVSVPTSPVFPTPQSPITTWTCSGSFGGTSSPTCTATLVVNGDCGPANGQTLTSAPTTDLCDAGIATAVAGSGPWTWTCLGAGTGSTNSPTCIANIVTNSNPTTSKNAPDYDYCTPERGIGSVLLSWSYTDADGDPQNDSNIQVATNSSNLKADGTCTGCIIDKTVNGDANSNALTISTGGDLAYNNTYHWRVKVNNANGSSTWTNSSSFTTAAHPYSVPNFTYSPTNPLVGQVVSFTNTSTCNSVSPATCSINWNFGSGTGDTCNETDLSCNYSTNSDVTLTITNDNGDGLVCPPKTKKVKVKTPSSTPIWKEISPF